MRANKCLRIGFIGGGNRSAVGRTHFTAAQMDRRFRVHSGCFCMDQEERAATAEEWGIPRDRTYESVEAFLAGEQGRLDAVVVLTPTPAHEEHVIAALKAAYPVICEKALATSSAAALRIRDVLRQSRGFLTVTYNYTGYPMIRELKRMIGQGRLGRVAQIHIEMPQEGFARVDAEGKPVVPQRWRLADGAIPTISLDLGVHLHNLIDFLIGEKPVSLVSSQSSLGLFPQVKDNVMLMASYTGDVDCSMWFSKAALGNRNGLRIRVYGETASAEWFQMEPEILHFHGNRGEASRLDRSSADVCVASLPRYTRFKAGHPAGFLEAFANLYEDMADALLSFLDTGAYESEYVFTVEHAAEGLRMLEAIAQSSSLGQWQEVDLEL